MEREALPFGIIDGHCHVASLDFTPRSFVDGVIDNSLCALAAQGIKRTRTQLMELYLRKMQDPHCDELIAEMDEAGIEQAVLLLPDFTFTLKDSRLDIAEMMVRHRDILARHPGRFRVLAGVDPRWGSDGLALFERSIDEYGFHGLKLYPPCGYSPSDRSLYPFYELCAARGLPVLVHIGATSPTLAFDTARPIFVDQAARDFPSVSFILAHGSCAYVDECTMMCAYRPNVYLDISGFESMPVESLRPLLSRGINHKIIFGTDWPVFRLQGRQKDCVASLFQEGGVLGALRPRELEGLFRGSMLKLLPQASAEQRVGRTGS